MRTGAAYYNVDFFMQRLHLCNYCLNFIFCYVSFRFITFRMTDLEEKDNEMEVDIAQNEQKKLKSKMDEKDKDRFGDVPKVRSLSGGS